MGKGFGGARLSVRTVTIELGIGKTVSGLILASSGTRFLDFSISLSCSSIGCLDYAVLELNLGNLPFNFEPELKSSSS